MYVHFNYTEPGRITLPISIFLPHTLSLSLPRIPLLYVPNKHTQTLNQVNTHTPAHNRSSQTHTHKTHTHTKHTHTHPHAHNHLPPAHNRSSQTHLHTKHTHIQHTHTQSTH